MFDVERYQTSDPIDFMSMIGFKYDKILFRGATGFPHEIDYLEEVDKNYTYYFYKDKIVSGTKIGCLSFDVMGRFNFERFDGNGKLLMKVNNCELFLFHCHDKNGNNLSSIYINKEGHVFDWSEWDKNGKKTDHDENYHNAYKDGELYLMQEEEIEERNWKKMLLSFMNKEY